MLLIDGNNLWYAVMARGEPLAGISRTDLLNVLDYYASRSGEHIVVVLDGYPASGPPRAVRSAETGRPSRTGSPMQVAHLRSGCQHLYAAPRSADSVIAQFVSDSTEPRRLTLVSSDRELIAQVRKRRVHVIDSQEFAIRLERWLNRPRREAAEPEAKQTGLGPGQDSLKDWLLYFDLQAETSDISKGEWVISKDSPGRGQPRNGQEESSNQSSPSPDDISDSSSARQTEGQPGQPGPLDRAFQGVEPLKHRKRDVGNRRQGS